MKKKKIAEHGNSVIYSLYNIKNYFFETIVPIDKKTISCCITLHYKICIHSKIELKICQVCRPFDISYGCYACQIQVQFPYIGDWCSSGIYPGSTLLYKKHRTKHLRFSKFQAPFLIVSLSAVCFTLSGKIDCILYSINLGVLYNDWNLWFDRGDFIFLYIIEYRLNYIFVHTNSYCTLYKPY